MREIEMEEAEIEEVEVAFPGFSITLSISPRWRYYTKTFRGRFKFLMLPAPAIVTIRVEGPEPWIRSVRTDPFGRYRIRHRFRRSGRYRARAETIVARTKWITFFGR